MLSVADIKKKVIPILERYGVKRAALFGSFVRGEMKKGSDIDILVEIDKDISLLDFAGIKVELEDALGKKVDLAEYETLKPSIKRHVLKERVAIL